MIRFNHGREIQHERLRHIVLIKPERQNRIEKRFALRWGELVSIFEFLENELRRLKML